MTAEESLVRILEHDGELHDLHDRRMKLLEEAFRRLTVKLNRIDYRLKKLEFQFDTHLKKHG